MTMIARRVQIANRSISLFAIKLTAVSSAKFEPVVFYALIFNRSLRGKGFSVKANVFLFSLFRCINFHCRFRRSLIPRNYPEWIRAVNRNWN